MIRADGLDLELDCSTCLDFNNLAKELTDLNKLAQEIIVPIDVPFAPNNTALYKKYGLGTSIPARLTELNNDSFDLAFQTKDDESGKYTATLRGNLNDWIECASLKKICELDLGTVTHTEANILASWSSDNDSYQAGDDGCFPVYGNFGSQRTPETLSTSDIRYAIHGSHILSKGLCECGVDFTSPVIDANPHMWAYWMKKKWWENSGRGTNVRFRTTLSQDTQTAVSSQFNVTVIPQDIYPTSQPVDDPGGTITFNTDPTITYQHNQTIEVNGCVRMQGSVTNNTPPNQPNADFMILRVVCDGGTFQQTIFATSFQTININITIPVTNFNNATFQVFQGGQWVFLEGFDIWFEPKDKHFYEGDILNKAEMLDCNRTVIDVLKSYVHMFTGQMDFNENTRKLFMSSPYAVDGIEGFFKGMNHTKLIEKVLCNTKSCSILTLPENKRVHCFADSKDAYVDSQIEGGNRSDNEEEYGVLSSYDELGFDNDKLKKSCNPFLEPTLNDFNENYQEVGQLYTPQFLDNLDGEQSNCVNPRVFYIFNGQQTIDGDLQELYFNGNPITSYPTIYQELPDNVDVLNNPDFDRQQLTYQELYEKYYKKYLKRTAANIQDSFKLLVTYKEYKESSFRNRYRIRYDGIDYVGILKRKTFNSCGKVVKWYFVMESLDC